MYNAYIWDTPGCQIYRMISPSLVRDADAIVFVYDITRRESFEELDGLWDSVKGADAKSQLVLIANKLDLVSDKLDSYKKAEKNNCNPTRKVSFEEGVKYAMKHGMSFYEVSAKSDLNVYQVFDTLIT